MDEAAPRAGQRNGGMKMAFKNLFSNEKKDNSEPATVPNYTSENDVLEDKKSQRKSQNDSLRTRCEVLKLRLTKEEKDLISKKSAEANTSMTDFIMEAVNGSQVIVIDKIPQLYLELLRQGKNLNQLLKIAHQTDARELSGIEEAVKQCSESHKKLMKFCDDWDVKLRNSKKKKEE